MIQSPSAVRIAIVGGGVAGVETALTLALGHPDAEITLVTRSPVLRVVPNLVYVPFGVPPEFLDIRLEDAFGPLDRGSLRFADVVSVDTDAHVLHLSDGASIAWDLLIAAPGTVPNPTSGQRLRNLSDAQALQVSLDRLANDRWMSNAVIRVLPDSSWSAPAYELAFLLDGWLRAIDRRHDVDVAIVTDEREPFELLGAEPVAVVADELRLRSIDMLGGMQPQRIENIDGDIVIDVGGLRAGRIRGLAHLAPDGYFATDPYGRVAPDVFVVGDAAGFPIKAGFASSWQVRRVLEAIGGDVARLGPSTDGIPHDMLEYQMDLAGCTLAVRLDAASFMLGTGLRPAQVEIRQGYPDKLRGTLIRQQLIAERTTATMPERYRRMIGVRQHLLQLAHGQPPL